MPFTPLLDQQKQPPLHVMNVAQWQQHYQAETVDLRYFFHSGWSS